MHNNILKKLLKYSDKCAALQTKNLAKSKKYEILIDEIINTIKKDYIIKLKTGKNIIDLPVGQDTNFFRPLFKMATHKKIKEARADDTNAVDFDVPLNSGVKAAADGIITAINKTGIYTDNNPQTKGEDNYIYAYNEPEDKIYCYRHIKPLDNLNLNSRITKNDLIGYIDGSGYSITPHLHFAVYNINKKAKFILKSLKIEILLFEKKSYPS